MAFAFLIQGDMLSFDRLRQLRLTLRLRAISIKYPYQFSQVSFVAGQPLDYLILDRAIMPLDQSLPIL